VAGSNAAPPHWPPPSSPNTTVPSRLGGTQLQELQKKLIAKANEQKLLPKTQQER
jgi:hypothetical protein